MIKMVTLVELKVLAKKQGLSPSGTKGMIARRILNLRRRYLTKSQIEMLVPLTTKPKKSGVKVVRKQKTKKSKQSPKKKTMNLAKRDPETLKGEARGRRMNPVEKMLRKLRTFD